MRNFDKLDDALQEYVIKQLDILLEAHENTKKVISIISIFFRKFGYYFSDVRLYDCGFV